MALLYVPSPAPFRPHAPTWRQPLFLHYAPLRAALARELARLRGRVLDVGCGSQPYRDLLGAGVTEYVGVDRAQPPGAAAVVVGAADALPFATGSFDAVLSTQVFEHVARPEAALREAARVLRPGGRLVVTVPGVWPAHEVPHDYWRFTRHGLARSLAACGLAGVEVAALGGLWSVVGQVANLELSRVPGARELVPLVNVAAAWLDRRGAREDLALSYLATGDAPR